MSSIFSLVGLTKQTPLRCSSFSLTSSIFCMRQTSFLQSLDWVYIIDMIPDVSESRTKAFISVISAKMQLKQSSAIGSRLQSSPFFFIFKISDYYELLSNIILLMFQNQLQTNQKLRQINTKRFIINAKQRQLFQKLQTEQNLDQIQIRHYYSLIVFGIPTKFRCVLWPNLLPNYQNISYQSYLSMIEKLNRVKKTLQEIKKQQEAMDNQTANNNQNAVRHPSGEIVQVSELKKEPNPQITSKIQSSIKNIQQDIYRTFPQLKIYDMNTEEGQKLANILGCFALYREDIGYVQGFSQITAVLLQQLGHQYMAFVALNSLITKTCLFYFFTFGEINIEKICRRVGEKIKSRDSSLYYLLDSNEIEAKIYVINWSMTLFTRCFQLDSVSNMWDILFANNASQFVIEQLCSAIVVAKRQSLVSCLSVTQMMKVLLHTKLSPFQEEEVFQTMRKFPLSQQ